MNTGRPPSYHRPARTQPPGRSTAAWSTGSRVTGQAESGPWRMPTLWQPGGLLQRVRPPPK